MLKKKFTLYLMQARVLATQYLARMDVLYNALFTDFSQLGVITQTVIRLTIYGVGAYLQWRKHVLPTNEREVNIKRVFSVK